MKNLKLLFSCLFLIINAAASGQDILRTYQQGEGRAIKQTADSGFIITGESLGKVLLIKTNLTGDTLWTRTFSPGDSGNIGNGVEVIPEGYLVAGTCTTSTGNGEAFLLKTDSAGNELWSKTYGTPASHEFGNSLVVHENEYVLAGRQDSFPAPARIILFNTDTAGNENWREVISDDLISFLPSEIIASDSGYVIVGTRNSGDAANVYLLKTDSLGNKMWDKTYGGNRADTGTSVVLMPGGGYALTGSYGLTSGSHIYLVKTDNAGTMMWAKVFGDDYYNIGTSVVVKNDTITVAGKSYDQSSSNPGYLYLAKTKSDGSVLGMCKTSQALSDFSMPDLIQVHKTDYVITGGNDSLKAFLLRTEGCPVFSSIEEMENRSGAMVYPNPFTKVANVIIPNTSEEALTFRLYNSIGQEVLYMQQLQGNSFTINAENLPGGIYFYSLQGTNNIFSGKVIIQ